MRAFYAKHGLSLDPEVELKFAEYDWIRHETLSKLNQRLSYGNNIEKCISEAEIDFMISKVKNEGDLADLHAKACYTAIVLTQELIEGKVPIRLLLD